MKKSLLFTFIISFTLIVQVNGQKKFAQIGELIPTPNEYRNAAGAPGYNYYQQQADYKMNISIDDETQVLSGDEIITYTNNSPDQLSYLWLQLDQIFCKRFIHQTYYVEKMEDFRNISQIERKVFEYDGGFKVQEVKNLNGSDLKYSINKTVLRIDLDKPLKTGSSISFKIKWWYNINDRMAVGGAQVMSTLKKKTTTYIQLLNFSLECVCMMMFQLAKINSFWVEENLHFPFGDYDVSITVPADHILGATGELQNTSSLLTNNQKKRLEKRKNQIHQYLLLLKKKLGNLKKRTPKGQRHGNLKQRMLGILLLRPRESLFGMPKIQMLMEKMSFHVVLSKEETHCGSVIQRNLWPILFKRIQNIRLITPILLPFQFIQNQ